MKRFHTILVVAATLNLILVWGWMGLDFSNGIVAKSSIMTTSSSISTSPQVQLKFTSNGGILETAIVEQNEKYTTDIIFTEIDSGGPILGAGIKIRGDTDKAYMGWKERGFGIYIIEITPTRKGRLSFEIEALKDGYGTSSVHLVLSVDLLLSELRFASNDLSIETGEVEVNSTYTTYVIFTRSMVPVNNASLEIVSIHQELEFTITSMGQGVYCVNISLSEVRDELYVGIAASADGVASSSVDLLLTSTPIQTNLWFTSTNRSTETGFVKINETYTTVVQLLRTSALPNVIPIENASIEVITSNTTSWAQEPLGIGKYKITITVTEMPPNERITITVVASKFGFSTPFARLTLFVSLIPTSLVVDDPDFVGNRLEVNYTNPIEATVRFQDDNGRPLAWSTPPTIDSDGLLFRPEVDLTLGNELGQYVFHFNASSPRKYNVMINATATGHEYAILNLEVIVKPFPIKILDLPDQKTRIVRTIFEDHPANVTLTLWAPRLNRTIDDAAITYSLKLEGRNVTGTLNHQENGTYEADLSGLNLGVGTYNFNITVEKEHYETRDFEYSLVIQPKPPSKIEKLVSTNWRYFIGGAIVTSGVLGYWLRRKLLHRKQRALFEERKRFSHEWILDVLSFQDLLIVCEDAELFYGFKASSTEESFHKTLDSAFLMALKTFSGESLMLDELKGEDHFRFGDAEIFLISGDLGAFTFAFLFKAQMIDDEWKRKSSEILERCREVVEVVEVEFRAALQHYEISHDPNLVPKSQITRQISKILELDVGLPHELTGERLEFDTYFPDKELILESILQLAEERGAITVTMLLERLTDLGVPADEAVFIFYQLRTGEMIRPTDHKNRPNI